MDKEITKKDINKIWNEWLAKHHPNKTTADIFVSSLCDECKKMGALLLDLQKQNAALFQENGRLEATNAGCNERLTNLEAEVAEQKSQVSQLGGMTGEVFETVEIDLEKETCKIAPVE